MSDQQQEEARIDLEFDISHELSKFDVEDVKKGEKHRSVIEYVAVFLSVILIIITFPLSLFFCLKLIYEYERSVIFRLGHLRSEHPYGPGIICIIPCTDIFKRVDIRIETFEIPTQQTLTKDSSSVEVDGTVFYQVLDPLKAVLNVLKYRKSTRYIAATSLRSVIGKETLIDLITDRARIAVELEKIVDEATNAWGVYVSRVTIKKVRLPSDMQRSMAAEAESKAEALAKIAQAHGEQQAATILKRAADEISKNPIALQLRYLQTLSLIASEQNHTIVIPVPAEFLNK